MTRRVFLLVCCWLVCLLSVHANMADSLRQRLPSLHGKARLHAYGMLYHLSQGGSDQQYTLRCLNDYINELDRQHEKDTLALALVERVIFFYNYDLTDSVYKYVPPTLERLKALQTWDKYYEAWMTLCNTYVFSGKHNMALREVQSMFDDAKERDNKYGMGLAYYMMGNVYSNMHNRQESVSSYRKGIDLLLTVSPTPSTIADLYSCLGDEYESMCEYEKLKKLTVEWKTFLDRYFQEKPLNDYARNVLESYYYLACAQAALGLNQLDEADKMLSEVRRRIPSEEDYVGQSWLYFKAKLHLQRKDYQTALELNNRCGTLSGCLVSLQDLDTGERLCQRCGDAQPAERNEYAVPCRRAEDGTGEGAVPQYLNNNRYSRRGAGDIPHLPYDCCPSSEEGTRRTACCLRPVGGDHHCEGAY